MTKTHGITVNQTPAQRANLRLARQAAAMRDLAIARGGTGDDRRKLTTKEAARLKARRRMARASRKKNREGA